MEEGQKLKCVSGIHSDRCYCTKLQLQSRRDRDWGFCESSCRASKVDLCVLTTRGSTYPFPFPGLTSCHQREPISSSPLFPLMSPEVLHVGAWVYLKIHSTQPIIPNQRACHMHSVTAYLNKYYKPKWFHNVNIEKPSRLNSNVERL